jgi:hypothetical protein
MLLLRLQLRYCAEQLKAERQESGAPPIGEEAEVPDADEALRNHVATREGIRSKQNPQHG